MESVENALIGDGGKHYILFSYASNDLIGFRFLGLRFSKSTVMYLMSIFVGPYPFSKATSYVVCE